ncbi:MAG: hypothetical protein BGO21_26345 [Dyadobacter sp. 50-39]|uniref:trypsin-like peptidase domain-containing protein n=1 Tax=Dyadobacter sp. 50-39 TaxID=1895756 RepID=UPI00095E81BB|nr:trypsin-like peptidase domain-containing protein [Dyadobacter sp. 50-39]OJV16420.1 MAG: hypothetical protein BGO21_26345 [Dyadobacter sp. 50-39]
MESIFNSKTFPYHIPEGMQLLRTLSELFPNSKTAMLLAQRAEVDPAQIYWDQPIFYVWTSVLNIAAQWNRLRELLEAGKDMLPPASVGAVFLKELLDDTIVAIPAEPRTQDGKPFFIHDTDDVSEPESLLYHDDLTIKIGLVPQLIKTLEVLSRRSSSVCRITADFSGRGMNGTAFRIGEQTLLTNWHVLFSKDNGTRADTVTAEFRYEDDGKGGYLNSRNFVCDVNSIITNKENDWAIINVTELLDPEWEIVPIKNNVTPQIKTQAFIIQHPMGDRKRLGFVRNLITSVDDRVIHYLTDTQQGASGSAVFDSDGMLIALHHAGGRPQEVAGQPPVKKNEGIRISRIVADMQAMGVDGF